MTAAAVTHVYVYATNRDDFPYAVGTVTPSNVNGSLALVETALDALTIRDALAAYHGAEALGAHPAILTAARKEGYTFPGEPEPTPAPQRRPRSFRLPHEPGVR